MKRHTPDSKQKQPLPKRSRTDNLAPPELHVEYHIDAI